MIVGRRGQEKFVKQIFELKFTSKSLVRQAKKCEQDEKREKVKVKTAMEKGNMDGARVYAQNSIRKRNQQLNYMRLASRLDAVVAHLSTQSNMQTINRSMSGIAKALDAALCVGNLATLSQTMDRFENSFVNMEIQSEFVQSSMAGTTSLSTPENDVGALMQQVADDYGLEISVGLPQTAASQRLPEKDADTASVSDDDLSRRLAELRAR